MKILVVSGKFRQVIEAKGCDRRAAHRYGCMYAVRSGKKLGTVIRSSIHLGCSEIQDDDCFSSTKIIQDLFKKQS